MKQQLLSIVSSYDETCDLLCSDYVKHIHLSWNADSDELFRTVSDWCNVEAKIKKDGENFATLLKDLPVPPQR